MRGRVGIQIPAYTNNNLFALDSQIVIWFVETQQIKKTGFRTSAKYFINDAEKLLTLLIFYQGGIAMKKLCFIFLAFFLAAGCTLRQANFTVLSTKTVEISRIDLKKVDLVKNRQGKSSRLWFLFIPFGGPPTLEDAVDRCLENGGGDFMTSSVFYTNNWSILLFSYGSWIVKGDVGNSLSYGSADLPDRKLQLPPYKN